MSNSLYIANCRSFQLGDKPDVLAWYEIYKLLPSAVSLVDRSQKYTLPYNFSVYPGQELPKSIDGFSKTYEECCADRVYEILNKSKELNVPIYFLYSGGIDSTMVLVSFMKILSADELKNNFIVLLNQDSIHENPNFYYQYIRKNCRIMSSDKAMSLLDKKQIIVDGEHNDQLFGSDIIGKLLRLDFKYNFNQVCSPDNLRQCLKMLGMTNEIYINQWVEILIESSSTAPCEVKTIFQMFWWFNFVFKWQSVFFRLLQRADASVRGNIDRDLIDNYIYHFFSTVDFQKWSMTNPDLKIQNTWNTYKFHAKDLIYEYNKDVVYRDTKIKEGSLYRLFLSKDTPIALDTDFNYLTTLDKTLYYNDNNSFKPA